MFNTVYRLVAPGRFEVAFSEIDLCGQQVVVRPTHLSICHADQRYYQGTRPAEVLSEKLPMALIHEGIGEVVYDPLKEYAPGTRVVMIPNTPVEKDAVIAENYIRSSRFRASSMDGFMQENVALERDRLVRLPEGIDSEVAAFTELVSVSVHALRRFDRFSHKRRETVGIWGDGNLGYITAILFKHMFPETRLCIFGVTRDKLSTFSFADETFQIMHIPEGLRIDHAIECVGGEASQKAISQMIDHINPGMPTIVMQHRAPVTRASRHSSQPPMKNHRTFTRNDTAPPELTTSLPNGISAKRATLKHCMPTGIPTMLMHQSTPKSAQPSASHTPASTNQMMLQIKLTGPMHVLSRKVDSFIWRDDTHPR